MADRACTPRRANYASCAASVVAGYYKAMVRVNAYALCGKEWTDEVQAKNLGMHGGLSGRELYQSPIVLNP